MWIGYMYLILLDFNSRLQTIRLRCPLSKDCRVALGVWWQNAAVVITSSGEISADRRSTDCTRGISAWWLSGRFRLSVSTGSWYEIRASADSNTPYSDSDELLTMLYSELYHSSVREQPASDLVWMKRNDWRDLHNGYTFVPAAAATIRISSVCAGAYTSLNAVRANAKSICGRVSVSSSLCFEHNLITVWPTPTSK